MTSGSPARSMGSEDEDDDLFLSDEKEAGDEIIMEWARVSLLFFLCLQFYVIVVVLGCYYFIFVVSLKGE